MPPERQKYLYQGYENMMVLKYTTTNVRILQPTKNTTKYLTSQHFPKVKEKFSQSFLKTERNYQPDETINSGSMNLVSFLKQP